MPAIGYVTGLAAATAVGFSAWLVGGWGGKWATHVGSTLGLLSFAVFAAICAALAAKSARGRQRTAWMCLTVGMVGWVAGDVFSDYYELILKQPTPFPSLADAGYLLFPVGACLALVLFPTGYSKQSRARLVLDALIIAGALFEVSWVLVLENVYRAGAESAFALAVSLLYPVSDIVVVTVALLILGRARTRQRTTLVLLLAGNVLNAFSDSAYLFVAGNEDSNGGSLMDIGWFAALLALSSAALVSLRTPHSDELEAEAPSRASMWIPYPPLALAVLVCLPKFTPISGLGPILVTSALLVLVVLARQFIVVGQNRRLMATVADQALRDPLTGLANRALFNDRLTHAMQLHQRDNQSVSVLSLDLDDFKLVNDSLGHPAGDALLVRTAERILGCVRTGDTVARLGGDEFAIVMEGRPEHSRLVAHRVANVFDEPIPIDGHDLLLRPSIGLAVATGDQPDITADQLLKQADVAMYSAKRSRTGGVHTFTPDMHLFDPSELGAMRDISRSRARDGAIALRLLGQLRHAIDNLNLSLVYQPKFDLRDDKIVGVEALVRWPHPERGLLGPDHFLPMVREHGLMGSVTDLVFAQALDDAAHWQSRGLRVPLAINVFAPSLGDLGLPSRIVRLLNERGLSADALTIEITEDLLLDNIDRTRVVLDNLRGHGMRVAIDDFGSGYSALRYLRDLPIDEVKLDRQFIGPILVNERAAAIVEAVIDLAHVLGVTTVAEGVENSATAAKLRESGCEVAQGYYYSPPLTASELLEHLLSTKNAPTAVRSL
ncbi:diguanylate cyclase (GGDEF)-like protein [Mycobacterium sp. OAS707]|uniref:putative bifunctional diguanylate cyclase/phosphodiesterase n=1 Tax=Mycobacterium sp. OAS707 TaxID=2663822 RepID=UPI00178B7C20|nr:diguanylate cyclase (GGDEF)-like protein [Mycobacterium sp. OAS707]